MNSTSHFPDQNPFFTFLKHNWHGPEYQPSIHNTMPSQTWLRVYDRIVHLVGLLIVLFLVAPPPIIDMLMGRPPPPPPFAGNEGAFRPPPHHGMFRGPPPHHHRHPHPRPPNGQELVCPRPSNLDETLTYMVLEQLVTQYLIPQALVLIAEFAGDLRAAGRELRRRLQQQGDNDKRPYNRWFLGPR